MSCSTVMSVATWAPSGAGISGYKTVAVNATSVYKGRMGNYGKYVDVRTDFIGDVVPQELFFFTTTAGADTASKAAESVTAAIEKALNQGVYRVYGANATGSLIGFAKKTGSTVRKVLSDNNIEMLVTSSVDFMAYDEYISVEERRRAGKPDGYNYYLNQDATLTVSVKVQDVDTLAVLWSGTLTESTASGGKYKSDYKTLIGVRSADGSFSRKDAGTLRSAEGVFNLFLEEMGTEIKNALTPHRIYSDFTLMKNVGKIKTLDLGYRYAENRMYESALTVFLAEWERSHYEPAGYNAALMYFGTGNYEKALEQASEVYAKTGNIDLLSLIDRMNALLRKQQDAYAQMEGNKAGSAAFQDLDI